MGKTEMPRVKNCSNQTYSVWGRQEDADGMFDGPEEWLDMLAPGGTGDFPRHGQLVIRDGDGSKRGARVAGPFEEAEFHVGGKDGEFGPGARCNAGCAGIRASAGGAGAGTRGVWLGAALAAVLVLALVAVVLAIALRR